MDDFQFEIKINGINEIIEDTAIGKNFVAIKEIKWGKSNDFKLDIRRWYAKDEDNLLAGKGISLSEDAGHKLTEVLIRNNYGRIDEILSSLKCRVDIPMDIKNSIEEYQSNNKGDEFEPDGTF